MEYLIQKLNDAVGDIEKFKTTLLTKEEADEMELTILNLKTVAERLKEQPKLYCGWTVEDAEHMFRQKQEEGKYEGVEYTEELGKQIMDLVDRRFDAEYGVAWLNIEYAIEEILDR